MQPSRRRFAFAYRQATALLGLHALQLHTSATLLADSFRHHGKYSIEDQGFFVRTRLERCEQEGHRVLDLTGKSQLLTLGFSRKLQSTVQAQSHLDTQVGS